MTIEKNRVMVSRENIPDANESGTMAMTVFNIIHIDDIAKDRITFTEYEIYRAILKPGLDPQDRKDTINAVGRYVTSIEVSERRVVEGWDFFETAVLGDSMWRVFSPDVLDRWLSQLTPQSTYCAVAADFLKHSELLV